MSKSGDMVRRESNTELLRIVSIFMIIVFHCAFKSGFSFGPGFSFNKLTVKFLWMLGELGVNLFMLISGYYMTGSRFKWKKLVRLLAEVQFYTWGTVWLGKILGVYTLSGLKNIFVTFFPVMMNRYWFITAYILIYILSPFFNLLIQTMDDRTYRMFLKTLLGIYCVVPTVFGLLFNTTEGMLYYNRMIWLAVMYFFGAYIRNYGEPKGNWKKYAVLALCAMVILVGSILVIDRFSDFFALLGTTEPAYFWPPNSVPILILSAGFFGIFRNLKIPYHPVVNILASTTLGIYLLHDGILTGWIWGEVFRCAQYQDSPYLVFRILTASVIIFAAGAAVDLMRQVLERCVLYCLLKINSRWRSIRTFNLEERQG